jgi:predicted DNA-binding protein|tara:strand:- start:1399 stop:1560 length:162 start_codon:yes stop_codon:yes gene_type:complete
VSDLKPFLVRLTPQSVQLLNKAAKSEEKTKASLINEAIKSYLTKDINTRLNTL